MMVKPPCQWPYGCMRLGYMHFGYGGEGGAVARFSEVKVDIKYMFAVFRSSDDLLSFPYTFFLLSRTKHRDSFS